MKILLHTCCGPCCIYPVQSLRSEGLDVMGFFFRSNIHPYQECMRREETLKTYAQTINLKIIVESGYDLEGFLQKMVFREPDRCAICYHQRLKATAALARRGHFDSFSTTLLFSKFQNHDKIKQLGISIGRSFDIPFLYRDFRTGWTEGVQKSKALNMYRQQYCGCIYSEKERYFKRASGQSG